MSGGSFNNLWYALEDSPFSCNDELDDMIKFLDHYNCPKLTQKVKNLKNTLINLQEKVEGIVAEMSDDLRTIEWVASGDYTHSALEEMEKKL